MVRNGEPWKTFEQGCNIMLYEDCSSCCGEAKVGQDVLEILHLVQARGNQRGSSRNKKKPDTKDSSKEKIKWIKYTDMVSEREIEFQMGNEEKCGIPVILCFQLFVFSCMHIFPFLIFDKWQSFHYSFSFLARVLKVLIPIFILSSLPSHI